VAESTFTSLVERNGRELTLPEDALRSLAPAIRFRVIAKAAATSAGSSPATSAFWRRKRCCVGRVPPARWNCPEA
jgi:hypothetical protein